MLCCPLIVYWNLISNTALNMKHLIAYNLWKWSYLKSRFTEAPVLHTQSWHVKPCPAPKQNCISYVHVSFCAVSHLDRWLDESLSFCRLANTYKDAEPGESFNSIQETWRWQRRDNFSLILNPCNGIYFGQAFHITN